MSNKSTYLLSCRGSVIKGLDGDWVEVTCQTKAMWREEDSNIALDWIHLADVFVFPKRLTKSVLTLDRNKSDVTKKMEVNPSQAKINNFVQCYSKRC